MQEQNKKIKVLEWTENVVRLELADEDHTLLVPLTSKLLEDERVAIATYEIKQTLRSHPVLYVKMKEGDPLEAIIAAATALVSEFEEFERQYKAAIV